MIKIKVFAPTDKIRCTVQFNGRMGFTWAAMQYLELRSKGSIALGQNQDDSKDVNLYMYVYGKIREDAFTVNSTGDYLYLNAKSFFDYLDYDYKNNAIYFGIVFLSDVEGGKLYTLEKRESIRKRKY